MYADAIKKNSNISLHYKSERVSESTAAAVGRRRRQQSWIAVAVVREWNKQCCPPSLSLSLSHCS